MLNRSGPITRTPAIGEGEIVGRDAEIVAIQKLADESRLLTLVGPGGIGKSRLATEVARRALRKVEGNAWFVSLDELSQPDLLTPVICGAFGLAPLGQTPLSMLVQFIGTRRVILVLDNCEHLVGAVGSTAELLVEACPGLSIVATSRQILGVSTETVFPVPPLANAGGSNGGDDAVDLFLTRARAAVPGYAASDDERDVIRELCRHLDALPLAIELAAARVVVLTPHDMLNRMSEPFTLLARGPGASPTRQRGLRASIEWSYELCSESERTAWTALSIFEGPFTLDAAEAVLAMTPVGPALDVVQSLVEKALLDTDRASGSVEFRMLEMTRQFGRELMADDVRATLRSALFDYARAFCRHAADALLTSEQGSWSRRARAEISTIRLAIEIALETPGGRALSVDLLDLPFRPVWWANGWSPELAFWKQRLLALEADPTVPRLLALLTMGVAANVIPGISGDDYFSEATEIAERIGDPSLPVRVTYARALAALLAGDFETASTLGEEGVAATSAAPSSVAHLEFLQVASDSADALGNADRAVELAIELLRTVEPLNEAWFRSLALRILSINAWRSGRWDDALELARGALELSANRDGESAFTAAVQTIALILTSLGDDERAAALFGAVDSRFQTVIASSRIFAGTGETAAARAALADHLGSTGFERATRAGASASSATVMSVASGAIPVDSLWTNEAVVDRGFAPLTPREVEVARLVSTGATNKQIAAELFLSPRTVEGHVDRILAKLGLPSRARLAAWVVDRAND